MRFRKNREFKKLEKESGRKIAMIMAILGRF